MRESEEMWQRGEYAAATEQYDVALAEAIAAGDAEREGSLAMAKGVALLQRVGGGAIADEVLRREARLCLDRARAISAARGYAAQVEFVDMVARKEGLVPLPPGAAAPGAEPCAHHSGHCSRATHDAAVGAWAREAAEATSALEEGACDDAVLLRAAARDRAVWDAVLVRAVARVGVTNWDAVADAFARDLSGGVAEPPPNDDAPPALSAAAPAAAAPLPPLPLRSPPPPPTCTAAALAARWAALRPAVRDAMKRSAESGEELACGHACATCPTRRECQLHDIVDIEDVA